MYFTRVALYLRGNSLSGTIPTELAKLEFLLVLSLSNNDLAGTIPNELERLPFRGNPSYYSYSELLRRYTAPSLFDIHTNDLSGTIPNTLNATAIHLYNNRLTGSIPRFLSGTVRLYLDHNQLNGSLIVDLFAMNGLATTLQDIRVDNNAFQGSLPTELGLCTLLDRLAAANNSLTGSVPQELGDLVARNDSQLTRVDVSGNAYLSGTIPADLCSFNEEGAGGAEQTEYLRFDCTPLLCGCDCNC